MRHETDKFSTEPYIRKIEKPWGYEIHWTPDDFPYMGKILHIAAGKRTSLQRHDKKQESWFLIGGEAKVLWDGGNGEFVETQLEHWKGYACIPGQRHRLIGITDCDIIETSTPEIGTSERLSDDYDRSDETEETRKLPNRGWNEK